MRPVCSTSVPISNLGELRWYVGCRLSRDFLETVTLSHQAVAEKRVANFGVHESTDTFTLVGLTIEQFDENTPSINEPFRSLARHLMWLANQTRPDILNAMRAVARYSHAPKRLHWQAALHVLMYIRGTSSVGNTYQRGVAGGERMKLFVDSDFANEATDRPVVCFW
ncbi:unnamed protein product [Pylaiella littoralis]